MSVPTSSLEFNQGVSKKLKFTVVDENDLPINLSGVGVQLKWSLFPITTKTPSVSKTIGSGIEVFQDGVCVVSINPDDTKALIGQFDHELIYIDNDENRCLLHIGTIEIIKTKTAIGE